MDDSVAVAVGDGPVRGPARTRFNVGEYHRMEEAGLLPMDYRCELIEGRARRNGPMDAPHVGPVFALTELLVLAAAGAFVVSVQSSIRPDDRSEPEPGVMLVRRRHHRYHTASPSAEDAALVIEVADSSLAFDRQVKTALYARHGIAELWIVDVAARAVDIYRAPADGRYISVARARVGGVLSPLALPQAKIAVADVVAA